MASREDEQTEPANRFPEVTAALAALVFLVAAEFVLFDADRVSQDAVDLVTLSAFGGLAVAALRAGLRGARFPFSQVLSSLAIGIVAALAVLHSARSGAGIGPLAPTLGAAKTWAGLAVGPALLTGVCVTGAASAVQVWLDPSPTTRMRFRRLAVVLLSLLVVFIVMLAYLRGIASPATGIPIAGAYSVHVPAVTISLGDSDTFMFVLIGLVAAIIAGRIVGHAAGFFLDLVIGILGAFMGRWVLDISNIPVGHGLVTQLLPALIGAFVLMAVARAFGGRLLNGDAADARDHAATLAYDSTTSHQFSSTASTARQWWRLGLAAGALTTVVLGIVAVRQLNKRR